MISYIEFSLYTEENKGVMWNDLYNYKKKMEI